jgi:Ca2+-binding EF-hand superfamily protein
LPARYSVNPSFSFAAFLQDVLSGEVEVVQPCPAHALCSEVPRSGMYGQPDQEIGAYGQYGRSYCPPDARFKLEPGPYNPAEPTTTHQFSHSFESNPHTPFNRDVGTAQALFKSKIMERDTQIRSQGKSLEHWQKVFDNYDTNGDGFIDVEELKLIITNKDGQKLDGSSGGKQVDEKTLEGILDAVDVDGDKRLNPVEFVHLMKMWKKAITSEIVDLPGALVDKQGATQAKD